MSASLHVLVLEDVPADAELVQATLTAEGYECTFARAATREEFVAALEGEPVDLVLADFALPGFDGPSALAIVRERDPYLPFIFVSGSIGEERALECLRQGATDYVLKDRLSHLGPAVRRALDEARQRQALEHYRDFLRRVIDTDPSLIFVKDWHGRFELANRAVAEAYGTTVEGIIGKTDADFNPNREEVEWFLRDDREVMTSGRPKLIPEEPVTNASTGVTRWFQTVKVPLRVPGSEFPRVLGVATDITERRRLETELRQAQKMEAIGQLTSGIAHDFNNILSIILSSAQLIGAALPVQLEEFRSDLAELESAALRGRDLIKKLLGFSRRERISLRPLSVAELVGSLSSALRRLLPATIAVEYDAEPGLPPVLGDAGAIEQILLNLVTNARDAMPRGGTLRLAARRAVRNEERCASRGVGVPGEYVCLSVADAGVGMDAETRRRLFEPFFTTKPAGMGTGLGMAMVHGLVAQHDGFVDIESAAGRGTTVEVYIPIAPEEAATEVLARRTPRVEGMPSGSETILVVDDDSGLRRAAHRVLANLGYSVLVAGDGEAALALWRLRRSDIALVISDMVMPKMSGLELYEAVRREGPPPKFLFATGYGDPREALAAPLQVDYLLKPWTIQELATRVREALDA